jgi:hypothetical protein
VLVDYSMVTNEVDNFGLYHRLRILATGSLLLSLVIAVIALVSLAPNHTGSEIILSSSQTTSMHKAEVTQIVDSKSSKDLKLHRSKKALRSLEVLAASRKAVAISTFPVIFAIKNWLFLSSIGRMIRKRRRSTPNLW